MNHSTHHHGGRMNHEKRSFAVLCFVLVCYVLLSFLQPLHISYAAAYSESLRIERNEPLMDEGGGAARRQLPNPLFFKDEEQLLEEQINYTLPSMTVLLVKDGQTLLSVTRGLEQGQLNEGVDTFDVGSLSRLTTSLALLELMESKGIKLEDEIGGYLPEQLQSHRDGIFKKIRFMDLLTHSTGFVNHRFGTASLQAFATSSKQRAMNHLLSRGTVQLFAPGKVSMYSNVSHTLAGLLISELSGASFESYVQSYLRSLGMQSSHIVEDWKTNTGGARYYVDGGNFSPAPDYYALLPSSDSLVTTPKDMTELLRALTENRFPRGFRLFESVFSNSRYTSRSTAFNIVEYHGRKMYMLDGSLPGAFSRIAMIPEWNVAFFIYYNSDSVDAREVLTETLIGALEQTYQRSADGAFEDAFDDATDRSSDGASGADENGTLASSSRVTATAKTQNQQELSREDKNKVRRLAGDYKTLNYSPTTPESISAFAHQLRINEVDGGLMIDRYFYRPIQKDLSNSPGGEGESSPFRFDIFYSEKTDAYIEFKTDDRNRFTYVIIGNEFYTGAFSSTVQITLLILFGMVLFLLFVRIVRKWNILHTGRVDDRPRVLVLLYSALMLGILGLTALAVRECTYWGIAYGGGWALGALRLLGWVTPPALVLLVWTVLGTKGDYKWRGMTSILMYLAIPLHLYFFFWLFNYRLIALF